MASTTEKTWFEQADNRDDQPLDDQFLDDGRREEEKAYVASPLTLMWWRFRKHRMAVISAVVDRLALSDCRLCRICGTV